MIKRILVGTLFILFMGLVPTISSAELQDKIHVSINGEPVEFNEITGSPFSDEYNRIQVPFKATLEKFGAKVNWLEQMEVAIAEKNGIYLEVPNGKPYIFNNGIRIDNESSSLSQGGRLYLPIRIVMEQFGCDVQWDSMSKTVIITYSNVKEENSIADKRDALEDKKEAVEEKDKQQDKQQDKQKVEEPKAEEEEYYYHKYDDDNLLVDFYGTTKRGVVTDYKKPIITFDEEIPTVTNKDSFMVSGTCENTEYIVIHSPLNFNTKTTPVNNRFSIMVKLITDDELARKEKGVGNAVSILAMNGDKAVIKEYVVYYNDEYEEE
ncbi:copper amine oxidase N-terminal domain-containing protein [Desulforamulus aquiferis]|uniref:copper amine oxidase N-terminal domain-containing protein n=1 Tax=Desulforamulus aquiferis TaxID=1397668 RepID=UPI00102707AE|nr:copper amine oxidase N-terminal domain-containing protein [Desulforamulus aquiferis]RYD02702.1 hypothetical protein N752_23265 [Desulforamulus aquiferis]